MWKYFPSASARRKALRAFLVERRRAYRPRIAQSGARRSEGLSQATLAELAGVSLNWYELFESGRDNRRASPQFINRVARALDLGETDKRELFRLALTEDETLSEAFKGLQNDVVLSFRSFREVAQRLMSASDIREVATVVAEAMHAAATPDSATISVFLENHTLAWFGLGARSADVRDVTYPMIWSARTGLPFDHIAVVENQPAPEQFLRQPVEVSITSIGDDARNPLTSTIVTPDVYRESGYPLRARSSLSLPLVVGNTLLSGVVGLFWTTPREFTRAQIEIARAVAAMVRLTRMS